MPGGVKDGFGDGKFNTPSLVEAADTAPFFHNNRINTIEGAVDFYNSKEFDASPASRAIDLSPEEVDQVAAFLRVINALENIRVAIECGARAKKVKPEAVEGYLALCVADIEDAIQVLEDGPFNLHPDAVLDLKQALARCEEAPAGKNNGQISLTIDQAMDALKAARGKIVE